eukprot:758546-Hanusia_phi.AAC.3
MMIRGGGRWRSKRSRLNHQSGPERRNAMKENSEGKINMEGAGKEGDTMMDGVCLMRGGDPKRDVYCCSSANHLKAFNADCDGTVVDQTSRTTFDSLGGLCQRASHQLTKMYREIQNRQHKGAELWQRWIPMNLLPTIALKADLSERESNTSSRGLDRCRSFDAQGGDRESTG